MCLEHTALCIPLKASCLRHPATDWSLMPRGSISRAVSLRNSAEVCVVVVGYRGASASLLFLRLTSSFYLEEGAGSIIKRSTFVSKALACRDRLFDHVAVGWVMAFGLLRVGSASGQCQ